MIHAIDALLAALALACAFTAVVAYVDLPARAPTYTGFNGRPSRAQITKVAYLVGIVPLVTLSLMFTLATLSNINLTLPKRAQIAETFGDLLVLVIAWWGASMVWTIGESARGLRSRVPYLVMPLGAYAIIAILGATLVAIALAR